MQQMNSSYSDKDDASDCYWILQEYYINVASFECGCICVAWYYFIMLMIGNLLYKNESQIMLFGLVTFCYHITT